MSKIAFLFIGVLLLCMSCKDKAEHIIATSPSFDSLFVKADKMHDMGNKGDALVMMREAHSKATDLTIADEMNYYTFCNIMYGNMKDYDHCIALMDTVLQLLDHYEDNKYIISWRTQTYNAKADALFAEGLYTAAYDCYYKAQKLAKDNADSCSLRSYSYSLAMVLYKQQRYNESAGFFKEALIESAPCGQDFNLFYFKQEILDNIGLCYNALQQYDSAMIYYTKALNYIISQTGRHEHKQASVYEAPKAVIYGNMAEVYVNTNRPDTAKALYNKSISINLRKGYSNNDALIDQAKLAELYYKTPDMPMMHSTLMDIKAELDTIPDQKVEISWNRLMWQYYEQQKDSLNAYRHLRRYITLKDTYTNANKPLMATDLDTRVKDMERQYSINLLTKDKHQQKIYLIVVTMLAAMAIVIIFLVLRNAKRSLKNVRQLTGLNNTVNQQKQQLELALDELRVKEKDKSRILKSVAHDVMNPIAAIYSLAEILEQESEDYTQAQQEIMTLIKEACNNSLSLSKDILEAAEEIATSGIAKERTDISQLVSKSVELLGFQAGIKKQHIRLQMPQEAVFAYVYKEKIRRVVNNLIVNAIKFSHNGTDITILLEQKEGKVHIAVKDLGVGIPERNKPHIFDMFTEAKVPGTSGEKPHGLGLSISLHIARAHGGNIWFESTEGGGSTFHLEFPV